MKKILFLGAAVFQIPPIRYALGRGYYVITCDNVPENPGHNLAHKSFNVSTVDFERVLSIARQEHVDGIMTYGSDVSAPTAAYVAEKLGLPGNPLKSVRMLTNKAEFRAFLNTTNLQPLAYKSFSRFEIDTVQDYIEKLGIPVVIKPVDSAGSKGVSVLSDIRMLNNQIVYALDNSIAKHIIVEQYVQKMGRQICGDGFALDGEVVFVEFGDGHFYTDDDFLAPYAETFPSTHKPEHLAKVREKLQEIIRVSGFQQGPFNFDIFITSSGEPFIIEIGPRSGGNFIPEAIRLNTGVNVTAAAVDACLNWDFKFPQIRSRGNKFFACYMVHSRESGVLKSVRFSDAIRDNVFEKNMYLEPGDRVSVFHKANAAIGNIILCFDTFDEMQEKMDKIQQHCCVEIEYVNGEQKNFLEN